MAESIPSRSDLRFDPVQGRNFLPGIRREGQTNPQSLVSVPNMPGLNPRFLGSGYDVKSYVLLIAIRPSDGNVKPGGRTPWAYLKRVG